MKCVFLNTTWCLYAYSSSLTLIFHSVNDTFDCLAVHSGFTLVLPRQEASKEAHLVVVVGRHLLSTGDTPQDDVREGVGHPAGDGDSHRVHGDDQVIRRLGDKWSLAIWVREEKGMSSHRVMGF